MMRSIVQVEAAGDGNVTSEDESSPAGKQHLFCYWWWRLAPEFDERGRPDRRLYPSTVEEVSALTPRLRVLKEMERLAAVAQDSLDELRHRLFSYRSGDMWVPAGGVPKEHMDIPPVVTILLVGPSGAGKSSLVNLMYSVLGRAGLIPFARTSPGTARTRVLEEHNVLRSMRNGFCVYDSRGFEYERTAEGLEEIAGWVENGVHHLQHCSGGRGSGEEGIPLGRPRYVRRKVNCVLMVADMAEIHKASKAGDARPLDAARALFRSPSVRVSDAASVHLFSSSFAPFFVEPAPLIPLNIVLLLPLKPGFICSSTAPHAGEDPVLVLTHGDELSAEERVEGRLRVCEALGVSPAGGAYDIACLNEQGLPVEELDPVTSYSLAEVVYKALLTADRGYTPRRRSKEWVLCFLSWIMWSLSALFAFLSYCCSKLAQRHQDCKLKKLM
ncbi:hypothetical protein Taro_048618 [Colocasia esculenta]|uniref:G domain-containing protein n=1 Tax=Colocasia esculenta TaxID=4460 RepID=A0A843X8L6_COLES|nr:hypothetical protein [Colocasia esculenta]